MPREQREFYDEEDAIKEYKNYKKHSTDAQCMVFLGGLLVIAMVVGIVYNFIYTGD